MNEAGRKLLVYLIEKWSNVFFFFFFWWEWFWLVCLNNLSFNPESRPLIALMKIWLCALCRVKCLALLEFVAGEIPRLTIIHTCYDGWYWYSMATDTYPPSPVCLPPALAHRYAEGSPKESKRDRDKKREEVYAPNGTKRALEIWSTLGKAHVGSSPAAPLFLWLLVTSYHLLLHQDIM